MHSTSVILLAVVTLILLRGLFCGVSVYSSFLKGAAEGLRMGVNIFPALLAMLLLIDSMQASGIMALITRAIMPLLCILRIPPETASVFTLRPLTGSGSLAALQQIMRDYGADSRAARVAAVLMGSSETLLYTVGVYLAPTKIKRLPGLVPVSLVAYLCGAWVSGVLVK